MSRDALFQLGMGSALLKASQEEDSLGTRASSARGTSSVLNARLAQGRLGIAPKAAAGKPESRH
ncbi:MAG: hypothetical protein BroJett029_22700 [Alphaproteobacteria bacterium]|nr:MAG: hypothetical protein BroJett029_22700 [Alphaproteobacteria bacterium]